MLKIFRISHREETTFKDDTAKVIQTKNYQQVFFKKRTKTQKPLKQDINFNDTEEIKIGQLKYK